MNLILILILIVVALIGLRIALHRNRILGLLTFGISFLGIYLVIFPEYSTRIANALGVGRGADLLLYFLFVISILGLFFIYIRIDQNNQLITKLARSIALLSASKKDKN